MGTAANKSLPGRSLRGTVAFLICSVLLLLLSSGQSARAEVRFDVFLGFDGVVPDGSWFPVVFEISNDGPAFRGTVELGPANRNQSQTRTMVLELPTGTTKRFVMPVFSSTAGTAGWDARLLDEKSRVRAESANLRVRKIVQHGLPVTAAMTRSPQGVPTLPDVNQRQSGYQPIIARMQPNIFPDNPIGLEGLDTLYLNPERALELKAPQALALQAWVYSGGHLVVGIEQPVHVNGNEWLRNLLPCQLEGTGTADKHPEVQEWLTRFFNDYEGGFTSEKDPLPTTQVLFHRNNSANPYSNLKPDDKFEQASIQIAKGKLKDGTVLIGTAERPLAITAKRGRGQVTVLMFSPELEPFLSWSNRPWFWSRLTGVPVELFSTENLNYYSSRSVDGVFGAMIDSRQVRKLPVGWLLLLLVGYLVVIGPLDQYWLKKINRQMLTWLTFPAYVALFSVLIYVIGYRLRAGETEWNELHVVDLMPMGERADFRGHTFASIYSPVNARYAVGSEQPFATLRGEYMGNVGAGQEASKAVVEQRDNHFVAEVSVPVWVNQLFVADWWRQDAPPVKFTISRQGTEHVVHVDNDLEVAVSGLLLALEGQMYTLGDVPARQGRDFRFAKSSGTTLQNFVNSYGNGLAGAAAQRQHAFGSTEGGHLPNNIETATAASFISKSNPQQMNNYNGYGNFVAPHGFDLSPLVGRGDAVLFAWAGGYTPIKPLNKFSARRGQRNTMFRVAMPVESKL
ncbi:MAG: hypothetical protein JWM16_2647 [Verrucomicrobiales bacterium]|nr:hypothetical protein [Verrucomicrobiales bacterium]